MSLPQSRSADAPLPKDLSEQCTLYLLGELDEDACQRFVDSLEASPALRDTLAQQADLLAMLPTAFKPEGHLAVPVQLDVSPTIARWSMSASVLAVAGCLAVVVLGLRWSDQAADNPVASENLLIARAWADNQLSVVTNDFSDPEPERVIEIEPDASSSDDDDSTLDWMFIGLSANLDARTMGATSDG